jgi:hypothetical protein
LALVLSFAAFFVAGIVSKSGEKKWVNYGKVLREKEAKMAKEQAEPVVAEEVRK